MHRVRSTGDERSTIPRGCDTQRFVLCADAVYDRVFALDATQVVRSHGRAALLGWGNRQNSDSDCSGSVTAQKLREIRATASRENPGEPGIQTSGLIASAFFDCDNAIDAGHDEVFDLAARPVDLDIVRLGGLA